MVDFLKEAPLPQVRYYHALRYVCPFLELFQSGWLAAHHLYSLWLILNSVKNSYPIDSYSLYHSFSIVIYAGLCSQQTDYNR